MGQGDFIKFLEKEYNKNHENSFTKRELEKGTGKKIKDYSLRSAVNHGEIQREAVNNNGHEKFVYRYSPNGSFSITNFQKRRTSAVSKFHELSVDERVKVIGDLYNLKKDERKMLWKIDPRELSDLGENSTGHFPYVLRWVNYLKINGNDFIIPTVIEESSVVAADCYVAKLCYYNGGIQASVVESKEYSKALGQVQLTDIKDIEAKRKILENKNYFLEKAGEGHEHSKPYDLDVEEFDGDFGKFLVANLHIDPGDAMGAAVAYRMADSIAPELSKITGAKCSRGINSNYSGRLTRAKLKVPIENLARKSKITEEKWDGEEVKNGILKRYEWAKKDVKRAVTNNKGIMNDVIGVGRATAQDDRAIEAANAIYAIKSGSYQPLSKWYADNKYLYGELEMLIPCGIVGGEIKNYPKAEFLIKRVLKLEKADQLAEIMASVGLAGNLAALDMITTVGLKEGHQLHRK